MAEEPEDKKMRVERKELKRQARRSLKRHYWMFVLLCLVAGRIGSETSGGLAVLSMPVEVESVEEISAGRIPQKPTMSMAIAEALAGENEKSRQTSQELKEQAAEASGNGEGSKVLGRRRGALAALVNHVESGAMIATVIMAVNSVVRSTEITLAIFIVVSLLAAFAFWCFFSNMFTVIVNRIFLEGRLYGKVPFQRLLFLLRIRKWIKVSCTMLVTSIFTMLWNLTLVGGAIKYYSYFLVPYIAAENPDISPLQAITLSRRMMRGHKWECFVFELSYLGWVFLGGLTLGFSEVFYSKPYRTAAFAEYYARLRLEYKEAGGEGSELLNDRYLFEKADFGTMVEAYSDAIYLLDGETWSPKGVRHKLADFFGVTLFHSQDEQEYEERRKEAIKRAVLREVLDGETYPARLSAIPNRMKRISIEMINYFRRYSVWSLLVMFFLFSFVGWLWEVGIHLIKDGDFINRGVLHGPWLPIYGAGGVLILVLLNRFRGKPVLEFLAIIAVCGVVEYASSFYLEIAHDGEMWWDYSGYFLNLNGRICAEGLLVFGLGGMGIVYLLAPLLDNGIRKIRLNLLIPASLALALLFAGDLAYSMNHPNTGKGITDYEKITMQPRDIQKEGDDQDAILSCADGRSYYLYLSQRVS